MVRVARWRIPGSFVHNDLAGTKGPVRSTQRHVDALVARSVRVIPSEGTVILAIMFDLDGTLVQSERLKAQSFAIAVQRLRGLSQPDPRAVEAYQAIVGATIDVAGQFILLDMVERLIREHKRNVHGRRRESTDGG